MTDEEAQPALTRREREQLCTLLDELGPSAPTLCPGWVTKDLTAHLLIREGHASAVGIALSPLRGWQTRVQKSLSHRPFPDLVDRLRNGPPWYSPMHAPPLDVVLNTFEFYVHHEDVRRAQPGWTPRLLPQPDQRFFWKVLESRGKHFVRHSPVGVVLQDLAGQQVTIRRREPSVTLLAEPAELVLYLYGRQEHALVDVSGERAVVDTFRTKRLDT